MKTWHAMIVLPSFVDAAGQLVRHLLDLDGDGVADLREERRY